MFEIIKEAGLARIGKIKTVHGEITTPAFVVAATKAAVKALTVDQVQELGGQAILANTYHLMLQPGTTVIEQSGGLAEFMNWQGPSFTDSGGFQIMSLPGVRIDKDGVEFRSHIDGSLLRMSPEISMRAQHEIGADIRMAFDCPIGYGFKNPLSHEAAAEAMQLTHDWASRCLAEHAHFVDGSMLCGVVQGGKFDDLRRASAEFMAGQDFCGYAVGGMYSSEDAGLLKLVNQILPRERPRHWLGMGAEPRDLFVGVENGIDTFDCVAPTRQARNGALYTFDGRINIRNAEYRGDFGPIDAECQCPVCQAGYTRAYLAHLFRAGEILAATLASVHNEFFVVDLTRRIRQSLLDGNFQEFKEKILNRYY